ncbi:MAG: hypothetical protein ACR2NU_06255, partial [Aeoliella sp.]
MSSKRTNHPLHLECSGARTGLFIGRAVVRWARPLYTLIGAGLVAVGRFLLLPSSSLPCHLPLRSPIEKHC